MSESIAGRRHFVTRFGAKISNPDQWLETSVVGRFGRNGRWADGGTKIRSVAIARAKCFISWLRGVQERAPATKLPSSPFRARKAPASPCRPNLQFIGL